MAKRGVNKLKRAQRRINHGGRVRQRALLNTNRLGQRRGTIVHARFAQTHSTDNIVKPLNAGLQLMLKLLKVNLKAFLLAAAQSTASEVVGAQLDKRKVAKTRVHFIVNKCHIMVGLRNRTRGDRSRSRIRRDYTATGYIR